MSATARRRGVDGPPSAIAIVADHGQALADKLQPLKGALKELERNGLPADMPAAYAVSEGSATDVAIQVRGNPGEKLDEPADAE